MRHGAQHREGMPVRVAGSASLLAAAAVIGTIMIAGAMPGPSSAQLMSGPVSGPVSDPVSAPFDDRDRPGAEEDSDFVDPLEGTFDRDGATGGGSGGAVFAPRQPISPPLSGPLSGDSHEVRVVNGSSVVVNAKVRCGGDEEGSFEAPRFTQVLELQPGQDRSVTLAPIRYECRLSFDKAVDYWQLRDDGRIFSNYEECLPSSCGWTIDPDEDLAFALGDLPSTQRTEVTLRNVSDTTLGFELWCSVWSNERFQSSFVPPQSDVTFVIDRTDVSCIAQSTEVGSFVEIVTVNDTPLGCSADPSFECELSWSTAAAVIIVLDVGTQPT